MRLSCLTIWLGSPASKIPVPIMSRVAPASMGRGDVEHDAAAEGRADAGVPGEAAQHEAISGQQRQSFALDVDAREAALARADRRGADPGDAGPALRRAGN